MTPAEFVIQALHDPRCACSEASISHVWRATKKEPAKMTVVIPDYVAEGLQKEKDEDKPTLMMIEVPPELREEILSPIARPGVKV